MYLFENLKMLNKLKKTFLGYFLGAIRKRVFSIKNFIRIHLKNNLVSNYYFFYSQINYKEKYSVKLCKYKLYQNFIIILMDKVK